MVDHVYVVAVLQKVRWNVHTVKKMYVNIAKNIAVSVIRSFVMITLVSVTAAI